MAFDLSTARPMDSAPSSSKQQPARPMDSAPSSSKQQPARSGFDLSTARPVEAPKQESLGTRLGRRLSKEVAAIPDALAGTVELPLTLATGALASVGGIVAGGITELAGGDGQAVRDKAAATLTYRPRTASAQRSLGVIGAAAEPLQAVGKFAGDVSRGMGASEYVAGVTGDTATALAGGAAIKAAGAAANATRSASGAVKEIARTPTKTGVNEKAVEVLTARAGNKSDRFDTSWRGETADLFDQRYNQLWEGSTVKATEIKSAFDGKIAVKRLPEKARKDLEALKAARNEPVPIKEVVDLRRSLGTQMARTTDKYSGEFKAMAATAERLDRIIESSMRASGKADEYRAIQDQYRHFKATENMVIKDSPDGSVNASRVKAGISTGRFKGQFAKGDAPYQDLFNSLYKYENNDPARFTAGLKALETLAKNPLIAKTIGVSRDVPGGIGLTVRGASALLQKARTDPQLAKAIMDLPVEQRAALTSIARESTEAPAAVLAPAPTTVRATAPTAAAPAPAPARSGKLPFLEKRIAQVEVGEELPPRNARLEFLQRRIAQQQPGDESVAAVATPPVNRQPAPQTPAVPATPVVQPRPNRLESLRENMSKVENTPPAASLARQTGSTENFYTAKNNVQISSMMRREEPVAKNYNEWVAKYNEGGGPTDLYLAPGAIEAAGKNSTTWLERLAREHAAFMKK